MTIQIFEKVKQQDYIVFFEILSNTKKNTKHKKLVNFTTNLEVSPRMEIPLH